MQAWKLHVCHLPPLSPSKAPLLPDVKFINTGSPDSRYRMAKSSAELKELPADSTECFRKGQAETYAARDHSLPDQTSADFNPWYTSTGLKCARRQNPRFIRWVHHNGEKYPDNRHREQVMLFTSWKSEDALVDGFRCWEECCQGRIAQILTSRAHNQRFADEDWPALHDEVVAMHAEMIETEGVIPEGDAFGDPLQINPLPCRRHHLDTAVQLRKVFLSSSDYRRLVAILNTEQAAFLHHVLHDVQQGSTPLRAFLIGGAGVGNC